MTEEQQKAVVEEALKNAESFGLAKGVKPENVQRRAAALVAHGTDAVHARALATEAENTQVAKDGQSARQREEAEESARAAIGDKVRKMTIPQLTAFATSNGIVVAETLTKKEDILAAVLAGIEAAK